MKVLELKAQVCTNRQHGQYGIQSECGLVHADDEKSRAYIAMPARRAGSDGSMSASGLAGPGFDPGQ